HASRHLLRALTVGLGQEHHELVSPKADRHRGVAGHFLEYGGDPGEQLVARSVPVRVVDGLEMVEVECQQGEGKVRAAGPVNLVLQVAVQEPAVVNAGQLILEDQTGRIPSRLLEQVQELSGLHGANIIQRRGRRARQQGTAWPVTVVTTPGPRTGLGRPEPGPWRHGSQGRGRGGWAGAPFGVCDTAAAATASGGAGEGAPSRRSWPPRRQRSVMGRSGSRSGLALIL